MKIIIGHIHGTSNIKDATKVEKQEEGMYYFTVTKNNDGSYTVTNTYVPETTKLKVTKEWSENADQDGAHPTSVQVQLLKGDKYNY